MRADMRYVRRAIVQEQNGGHLFPFQPNAIHTYAYLLYLIRTGCVQPHHVVAI